MAEQVKISLGTAEYVVGFDRPYVGLIGTERQRVVEAIVLALRPFGMGLNNVEILATGPLRNHKTVFRLPERWISIEVSAEEYKLVKENALWATAENDVAVLVAAQEAILKESGAAVAEGGVSIGMHAQPMTKRREEILAPFMVAPLKDFLTEREVRSFGNHARWAEGDFLLDFSLVVANGIYIRLTRRFAAGAKAADVLEKLREEQETVFGILGIEEAPNA
jgi:hypothetical protein